MTNEKPRYSEEEFQRRSDDIARRTRDIKMKGFLISGVLALGAIGVLIAVPAAISFAGPLAAVGLALGSGIASLFTMQEAKKLELEEENLRYYAQGGNLGHGNWEAYAEHVAKPGYTPPSLHAAQGLAPQGRPGRK